LRTPAPRLVVVAATRPGVPGEEAARRHVRTARRVLKMEDRSFLIRNAIEGARERRRNHRPRIRDLHPLADAVRAAGPAGVHEPDARVVARDLLAEHPRVAARIEREERRAKARADRCPGFGDAPLGAAA